MSVLVFNHYSDSREIAKKAGCTFDSKVDICLSLVDGGDLRGGIIYSEFTDASCWCHVAGFKPRWLNRDLLYVAFDYPFRQLKLERMFCWIDERNKGALAFTRHIGWNPCGHIPGSYKGGYARILFKMEAYECHWLTMKPRKIRVGV